MSRDDRDEADVIASCLADMQEAIDAIFRFTAGFDRSQFANDERTIFAVRACFITLGEACNRLPQTFRDAHRSLPWSQVRQFRNFMVHVYDRVLPDPLWDTIVQDLPALREQLADLRK